jgi:hypothetical protein
MSWARLLKRVFDIDIAHCPHFGGVLKIVAVIEERAVIVSILTHLGLSARAVAVPGSPILNATTVLQRGPTIRLGPRSREAPPRP